VLARIARDILAIPGVSISVEWLFSSSKHTLSDLRSSLTAESASKTIVTKEWLRKGLGDGVNYLGELGTEN
jgi:hAT family C-terminal dimerisation region